MLTELQAMGTNLDTIESGTMATVEKRLAEFNKHAPPPPVEPSQEYLTAIAAELRAKGLRVDTQVRVGTNAVEEILAGARDVGADLIAMTTHGRGGLGRLLFGSVAEAVLRQADIPVFLMRQTKAQVAARAAWEAVR